MHCCCSGRETRERWKKQRPVEGREMRERGRDPCDQIWTIEKPPFWGVDRWRGTCVFSACFQWIFGWLNNFKWKCYKLETFTSFRDLQLSYRTYLHPRSFESFKNLKFEIRQLIMFLEVIKISNKKISNTKFYILLSCTTLVHNLFISEVIWKF